MRFPLACSLIRPLDMSPHRPIQRRRRSVPLLVPLGGRLALGRPGVDGGNLLLERGVDEAVPLEGLEVLELGGDDEGGEGLAAATCFVVERLISI